MSKGESSLCSARSPLLSPAPKGRRSWLLSVFIAVAFFAPLFRWGLARPALFWWWMSGILVAVNGSLLALRPDLRRDLMADFSEGVPKKVAMGLASAAVLYAIFFIGSKLLSMLLPGSQAHISSVYILRPALPSWLIALLMITIIGPGEELFWRLYLQNEMTKRFSPSVGLTLGSLFYAGVHMGSGNPVLVLAAMTAGLFWGALYLRARSAVVITSSHVAWDLAVFLFAPFSQ